MQILPGSGLILGDGDGMERPGAAERDEREHRERVDERGEHLLQIGYSTWQKGIANLGGRGDESIATCGAWTADDTYEVRICMVEDAFCPIFRFHYTGDELQLEVEPNASWDWEAAGVTKISGHVIGSA